MTTVLSSGSDLARSDIAQGFEVVKDKQLPVFYVARLRGLWAEIHLPGHKAMEWAHISRLTRLCVFEAELEAAAKAAKDRWMPPSRK